MRNGWDIAVFFTKEVPPNNNRGASSAELVRIALASSSVAAIATMNRVEYVRKINHSRRRCSGMGWILLYSCIALSVALTATMSPVQYVLESDHWCRRCCSGLG